MENSVNEISKMQIPEPVSMCGKTLEESKVDAVKITEKTEEGTLDKFGGNKIPEPVSMCQKLSEESKVDAVKIMEQDLKKEFPETYKEEEGKEEMEWKEKMGDNMQFVNKLDDSPYNFSNKGFQSVNAYGYSNTLSNALIVPLRKVNIYDGENKRSFIELKAILNTGEELSTISIPIKQIDSNNFYTNSEWGINIIFMKPQYKEDQRQCIKFLAHGLSEENIFNFTGMYYLDNKPIFLLSGGAIGSEKTIRVDLRDKILNKYCMTNEDFNIVDTIKISLRCLDTAPWKISFPLYAINFTAPLISTFEQIGIPAGFLTWVQGPHQSKKTSEVSAINSHFRLF